MNGADGELCGLSPFALSSNEQRYFHDIDTPTFLRIRNTLITQWQQDVHTYISQGNATSTLRDVSADYVKRVYVFLDSFGFINSGIIHKPIRTDDTSSSSSVSDTANSNGHANSSALTIVVVGAGVSGLAAARQLSSFGHNVIVIEGRDRVGGRVYTDTTTFSASIDLGASIITGLGGNPIAVLSRQIDALKQIHYIDGTSTTVIHGTDGRPIPAAVDARVDREYNRILAGTNSLISAARGIARDTQHLLDVREHFALQNAFVPPLDANGQPQSISLEAGMRTVADRLAIRLSTEERLVYDWFVANLEYACAAPLSQVDMFEWDQDDEFIFSGPHAILKNGYGIITSELANGMDIQLNTKCQRIRYGSTRDDDKNNDQQHDDHEEQLSSQSKHAKRVMVDCTGSDGQPLSLSCDVVVCTVSLGVLQNNRIAFDPPLPVWKQTAINSLGFGVLNKLVLEFNIQFWNDHDTFGTVCTTNNTNDRGKFYIFWNFQKVTGANILIALLTGNSAITCELLDENIIIEECLIVLRRIFSDQTVPNPIATRLTRWKSDEMSFGSYSFIKVGASGADYDAMQKPVDDVLFFAGEATNRAYPATVPGAYQSGLRAAGDIQYSQILARNMKLNNKLHTASAHVNGQSNGDATISRLDTHIELPTPSLPSTSAGRKHKGRRNIGGGGIENIDELTARLLNGEAFPQVMRALSQPISQPEIHRATSATDIGPSLFVAPTTTTSTTDHVDMIIDFHKYQQTNTNGNTEEKQQNGGDSDSKKKKKRSKRSRSAREGDEHRMRREKIREKSHEKSHKKSHEKTRSEKPRKEKIHDKSGDNRHRKSDSRETSGSETDRNVIETLVASLCGSDAVEADIRVKTVNKVISDWTAKSRPISIESWLDEKRRQSIQQLVDKYRTRMKDANHKGNEMTEHSTTHT